MLVGLLTADLYPNSKVTYGVQVAGGSLIIASFKIKEQIRGNLYYHITSSKTHACIRNISGINKVFNAYRWSWIVPRDQLCCVPRLNQAQLIWNLPIYPHFCRSCSSLKILFKPKHALYLAVLSVKNSFVSKMLSPLQQQFLKKLSSVHKATFD